MSACAEIYEGETFIHIISKSLLLFISLMCLGLWLGHFIGNFSFKYSTSFGFYYFFLSCHGCEPNYKPSLGLYCISSNLEPLTIIQSYVISFIFDKMKIA